MVIAGLSSGDFIIKIAGYDRYLFLVEFVPA
jgi:hypothetical protein